MKKKLNLNFMYGSFAFSVVQAVFISLLVLSSVYNVSCRVSTEGIQLLSGDYESPELLGVHSISSSAIAVDFSESVEVNGITLCEVPENFDESSLGYLSSEIAGIPLNISVASEGRKIICNLAEPARIGQKYILYGNIMDKNGNTLTFSSFVTGFNSNPATIVFSEIQDKTTPKGGVEFIEFYVLAPGNLAGLVVSSANDGEDLNYIFPSVEVEAKDVVVLHLRKDGEGSVSEFSDVLTLSSAAGSSDFARDIWCDFDSSRLGATQDVLLLTDGNSGKVKDCFMYSRSSKTEWSKPCFAEAAAKAVNCGIWKTKGKNGGNSEDEIFQSTFKIESSSAQLIFERTNIKELDTLAENGLLDFDCISVSEGDWNRKTPSKITPGYI